MTETAHVVDVADVDRSLIRRNRLTARNDAAKKTVIEFDDAGTMITDLSVEDGGTNAGPSPVLALVGSLVGCEAGTFKRTADEFELTYNQLAFQGEFRMDARTRTGLANSATHIRTIRLEARVHTEANVADLERIVAETERRCPISNLIRDAGIDLQTRWIRVPSD